MYIEIWPTQQRCVHTLCEQTVTIVQYIVRNVKLSCVRWFQLMGAKVSQISNNRQSSSFCVRCGTPCLGRDTSRCASPSWLWRFCRREERNAVVGEGRGEAIRFVSSASVSYVHEQEAPAVNAATQRDLNYRAAQPRLRKPHNHKFTCCEKKHTFKMGSFAFVRLTLLR